MQVTTQPSRISECDRVYEHTELPDYLGFGKFPKTPLRQAVQFNDPGDSWNETLRDGTQVVAIGHLFYKLSGGQILKYRLVRRESDQAVFAISFAAFHNMRDPEEVRKISAARREAEIELPGTFRDDVMP